MNERNGHLATLNLVRNPFPYSPDAGSYFLTAHLEEQFVELVHCIDARKGFCLLTAEIGMGKSTLVRRLMLDLQKKNVVSALVFNTFLQGNELLAAILEDFGLESSTAMSSDIAMLNRFLLDHHRQGKTCLLIIDDAQNLSASSLELIRLLCNLETDQEKLLQILLAGQPELEDTLSQHGMRQLRSRVAKHSRLHGLGSIELADYVKFRFEAAGSDGSLVLQADACQLLWKTSQGVPRQVHVIMDRCLYGLAAQKGNVIDLPLMRKAIQDSNVDLVAIAPALSQAERQQPAAAPISRSRKARWTLAAFALTGVAAAAVYVVQRSPEQPSTTVTVGVVSQEAATRQAPAALPAPAASQASESGAPVQTQAPQSTPAAGQEQAPLAALPMNKVGAEASNSPSRIGCTPRAGWPVGRIVASQPLSELTQRLLGDRLSRLESACTDKRQGQTWLTWSHPPGGYPVTKRATAAQMQIALTHYGSLRPGQVDGVWGAQSQEALEQFQQALGLTPIGELDALSGLILEKFYVQQR